jgi:hypothetical protein
VVCPLLFVLLFRAKNNALEANIYGACRAGDLMLCLKQYINKYLMVSDPIYFCHLFLPFIFAIYFCHLFLPFIFAIVFIVDCGLTYIYPILSARPKGFLSPR